MEDEFLPDLPNVLICLEETLKELEEEEDFSKVTKADLVRNQTIIIDAMMDIAKYMVAKSYKIDILDKAVARKFSLEDSELEIDDDDIELNVIPSTSSEMFV